MTDTSEAARAFRRLGSLQANDAQPGVEGLMAFRESRTHPHSIAGRSIGLSRRYSSTRRRFDSVPRGLIDRLLVVLQLDRTSASGGGFADRRRPLRGGRTAERANAVVSRPLWRGLIDGSGRPLWRASLRARLGDVLADSYERSGNPWRKLASSGLYLAKAGPFKRMASARNAVWARSERSLLAIQPSPLLGAEHRRRAAAIEACGVALIMGMRRSRLSATWSRLIAPVHVELFAVRSREERRGGRGSHSPRGGRADDGAPRRSRPRSSRRAPRRSGPSPTGSPGDAGHRRLFAAYSTEHGVVDSQVLDARKGPCRGDRAS